MSAQGRPNRPDGEVPADLHFYFDPVCPFAWMTSKWVRMVAAQRDYSVDWRFISLRIVNAKVDYEAHFPEDYEDGHTAGLRLLRVAARARAEHGRDAVGPIRSSPLRGLGCDGSMKRCACAPLLGRISFERTGNVRLAGHAVTEAVQFRACGVP